VLIELIPLAMLGAVLGLDVVGFPQAMISRPLVACTLASAFLGTPEHGLLLGAIVECFALETLPVGASRYPEWGSASVVGGALVAQPAVLSEGGLFIAVVATLATAWLGGWSMVQLRRMNAAWARARYGAVSLGLRRTVTGLQVAGLTADLVRGGLLTFVALLVALPAYAYVRELWGLPPTLTRAILVGVAGIVACGAAWKVFHSTLHTRWYLAVGLFVGCVLALTGV
jgi:PTS system mannose-specific IIC component